MKRVISILLVALMLFGMLPSTAVHSHAAEQSATLALNVSGNRTSFSSTKQVWSQNGITLTNNKGSSTSNVANYTPPRFYASSELIIECSKGNIKKIEIDCSSSSYATAMVNSAKGAGATASASNTKVTITPATSSSTFTISKMTAQVRCGASLTVYYEAASACTHTNTTTTTVDATCTEDGSVTVTCGDCGETVSTETIAALGHSYVDGICSACGNKLPVVSFVVPSQIGTVAPIIANEDGKVTLPSIRASYEGKYNYSFVGWAEESVSDTETAPTLYGANTFYTATKNTTLYAVYTYTVAGAGGSTEYVLKDASDIEVGDTVVITTTKDNSTYYAMSNGNGTSSAPTATKVTVSNGKLNSAVDNLKWVIGGSKDAYIFYKEDDATNWLYCTSTNNGVRVGTNNANTFKIDANSGYLYHNGTNRYIGIYNNADWRCYTNTTGNIANQTLGFFVKTTVAGDQDYFTSTLEDADTTCQHTSTTESTEAPTCTETGKTTVTCDDCGAVISETEIPATGHTVVTDAAVDATCVNTGLTEGSHCSVCKAVLVAQNEIPATGNHTYEGGVCTECGAVDESVGVAYVLVTDVNDLKVGDQIVIVAQDADYAMSATQGNNNRGQIAIEKNTSDNTVEISDAVQVLTLESGNIEGTFAFYTGEGYLYAASSGSNYLRTETTLSKNSSWVITIDAKGVATVKAQGANTRNWLRYNSTSSLFSCYASGQQDIAIYKKTVLCAHTNTTEVAQQDPTCTAVGYTAGVYCNDCESYISGHEVIDMIDHSWNDGVETTAPGCETTGVMTYTCTVCGETKTEEIDATGHTMGEGVVVEATCETAGSKTYTCTVCGKEQVETIAALGHNWGEGKVVTAATCESAGKMTYVCQNDDSHTKDEAIPALGHSYNTEGVCSVCGEEVSRFQMVTDYKAILGGGQFVLAVKNGDTYYALSTEAFGTNMKAVEVTVNENGADSWVQWEEGIPVWNVDYFNKAQNCFTLSYNSTYLTYSGSGTSFGSSADAYAWTFVNKDAEGNNESDDDYAVVADDGVVSFYTVAFANTSRAINLVNADTGFRVYSTNNNFDTVCFFKLVKAADAECTVTFMENGEQTMTQTVANGEVISLPEPANDTLPEGYTDFVGWVALPYMETLIAPTDIYYVTESAGNENTTLAVTDDMTLHALYSRTDPDAEGQSMSYHRVTNQNQISVGQYYIIVGYDEANEQWLAMSLDQYNDARGGSVVEPDEEGVISVVPNDRVASFRLEQGFNTNTYGFFDVMRNQFLSCTAATETNNSLRSVATLGEDESFKLEINEDGSYSIISKIKNDVTYLVLYNTNDNKNPLFSCYDDGTGIDKTKTYLYVGQTNNVPGTYYATGTCIHDWVQTAKVEATCDNPGYTQYTCSICGEVKLEDVLAHGHTVSDMNPTIEPTCTTTGLAVGYCTACKKEFEEILPATGHNFGDWTVDKKPSFTASGIQKQSCLNSNCDVSHEEEIAQLPFPVYSYGVTLGNSIGETFLIDPAYTQDATVTFTVAGKTYTYDVQKMKTVYDEDKDIYYPTASIPLASGQMTDAIHVVIESPENGTATKDYTVYEYAQYILNGEYSEKTKTLVREMLNYGNYAQIYFEYNMDDLANKDLDPVTPAEMPALDADNNKAEQTDNAENVDFFGCSLVHWFQTSINFYFKFSGNIESYEFSVNGEILTPEVNGNMCFVTVAGFNPQNLNEDVTIIVNDGTGELSVTYSPMDYITRMYYNGSAPVELKNLVQAMYGYHLAAVAYKTNSES